MKKFFKRLLIGTGIFLGVLLIAGISIPLIFGKQIKAYVLKQVNRSLASELRVNGDIDVSLFSHFPYASVTLNKVEMRESLPRSSRNLLTADEVSFNISIWEIFSDEPDVRMIVVQGGKLNMRVMADGSANYLIFKPSKPSEKSLTVTLEEVVLKGIDFTWLNLQSDQFAELKLDRGIFSGKFSADEFDLQTQLRGFSEGFRNHGAAYLEKKKLDVSFMTKINTKTKRVELKETRIGIEGHTFHLSGVADIKEAEVNLDLKLSGENLGLESLAALMPASATRFFSGYHSEGKLSFNGLIQGRMSAEADPQLEMNFQLTDATIRHDSVDVAFTHLNMLARFTNGRNHNLETSELLLSQFTAEFDSKPVTARMRLLNFKKLLLSLDINASLNLALLQPLLVSERVKKMDGILMLDHFHYLGPANLLRDDFNPANVNAGGILGFQNASASLNDYAVDGLNGLVKVDNNAIDFEKMELVSGGNKIKLSGSVDNLLSFIAGQLNDSLKSRPKLILDCKIQSDKIVWEKLFPAQKVAATSSGSTFVLPAVISLCRGNIAVDVKDFSWDKFQAEDISGSVTLTNNYVFFSQLYCNTMGGNISADFSLNTSYPESMMIKGTSTIAHLDITKLFSECNNFGLEIITDKNLKGNVDARVSMSAKMKREKIDPASIHALADVTINNGELINFEPMHALSKFVKLNELNDIKFSKLRNQLLIENRKVIIPAMTVNSSVLTLVFSGTHSFDNIIDYKIELGLFDLLTSRFKKNKFNPDEVEEQPTGLKLYLTMIGPADDPVIKYDKKKVKQKIQQDVQIQKQELTDALNQEFKNQPKEMEVKDWKPDRQIQFVDFGDTLTPAESDLPEKLSRPNKVKEKQKQEISDFWQNLIPK